MALFFESDFALTASGTFREATPTEEIRQDIVHLISDQDELGDPSDTGFAQTLRSQLYALLSTHPKVSSVDQITVTPNTDNTLSIDVFVNGSASAITATSTGGR